MKNVQHIFFDLDRTLWDFETNSREALLMAYEHFGLQQWFNDSMQFIKKYEAINDQLWALYRKGQVEKSVLRTKRFGDTLKEAGCWSEPIARDLGDFYIMESPKQKKLLPSAAEMLDELNDHYELHIITNGFDEVQHFKLENCGLDHYFDVVITSDSAGYKKPDERIFFQALTKAKAEAKSSLMVGDDWNSDIIGARSVGMKQCFYNPEIKLLNDKSEEGLIEVGHHDQLIDYLKSQR